MNTIWSFTRRNLLVYLKDRGAVFFSMLSVLMIFVRYIIFLAKMNIDSVANMIRIDRKTIAYLVNSWVMAGIIVVNSVTVTLGVLGTMVEDEAKNRMQGFLVSPVDRSKLTVGYILSAFFIGNILCVAIFILSQVYIAAEGGCILHPGQVLQVLGIIVISVFSSTCLVFLIVSLIRSMSAFTAVSILVGSTIGLIAGIYVPVGVLPEAVQKFMKCLPLFYNTALMRGVYMERPVSIVFKGAPDRVLSDYMNSMGVHISWGDTVVDSRAEIAIVILSGLAFLILSVILMRNRRVRRA
jgi:multidrug/hemolysin transport system permease protein